MQKKSIPILQQLISDHNLCDIWRERNGLTRKYTWSQKNPFIQCRLDYYFIPRNAIRNVTSCNIIPSILTDHKIIEIRLKVNKVERGPGLWRLNNSLLEDHILTCKINELIDKIWDDNSDIEDARVRWDFLKYKIMTVSRTYAKEKPNVEENRNLI